MSIKSIVAYYEDIKKSVLESVVSDDGSEKSEITIRELCENAEEAEKIIKNKVAEADFVKYMLMVQKVTIAVMATQGEYGVLLLEKSGNLTGYTHTVVMAVIGGLIRDEII